MNKFIYAFLFFPFVFSACNLVNPKEEIPTYLHLEPFVFTNPDSAFTGSSSHSIPSAKVFVNDIAVGTFDLPCTVPVLMTKTGKLTIFPQVTNQGLKSYVYDYPFYETDTSTMVYNPGKVQNHTPQTRYRRTMSSSAFRMKINFEEGLVFRNLSGDTSMTVEKDPAKVLEGKGSGLTYLNQSKKESESISTTYFEWPSTDCYLEFDYQGTIPFAIGLQAEDASGNVYGEYLAGFYPKSGKNKIYLSLSLFKNSHPTYTKLYIKVRANLNDNNGEYKEGYVLLDNLKVIAL